MLHIQMRKGEFLTIGDSIKVHFTKSGVGDSVTLSIDAPREIKVLRPKYAQNEMASLAQNTLRNK